MDKIIHRAASPQALSNQLSEQVEPEVKSVPQEPELRLPILSAYFKKVKFQSDVYMTDFELKESPKAVELPTRTALAKTHKLQYVREYDTE